MPAGAAGCLAGRIMRCVNARPNAVAVAALGLSPSDRVIELGCGPGHALRLIAARVAGGSATGIDRSATMLRQAAAHNRAALRAGRVRLCRARFESLPFPDGAFDKALAVNVAYFWHEPAPILAELRRVLRPGGRLALYVTDDATMRRWPFAGPDTHRHFDPVRLAAMLSAGGFGDPDPTIVPVRIARGIAGLVATATIPTTKTEGAPNTCTTLCLPPRPSALSPLPSIS